MSGPARAAAAIYAAIAAAAALIVSIFVLGRTPPPGYGCGHTEPPGHDAALEAFRSGAIPVHLACAALLAAALAWLSRERAAAAGRERKVGGPTVVGLALLLGYAGVSVLFPDFFVLAAGLSVVVVGGLTPVGAIAASLLIAAAIAWFRPRERAPRWSLAAAWLGWVALAVGLPASYTFVWLAGSGPLFC